MFLGKDLSSFLWIGETIAVLHSSGRLPESVGLCEDNLKHFSAFVSKVFQY